MDISVKKAARILRIRKIEEDLAKSRFYAAAHAYKQAADEAKAVGSAWSELRDADISVRTTGYSAYFHMRNQAQMRVHGRYQELISCREQLMNVAIRRRVGEKLVEYAKKEAQTRQLHEEIALLDDITSLRKEVKNE